jgi:hypothetical protein
MPSAQLCRVGAGHPRFAVLTDYAKRRDVLFATPISPTFFVDEQGRALNHSAIHLIFRTVARQMGLRHHGDAYHVMTCVTAMRLPRSCDGIAPATMSSSDCPSYGPIWGTATPAAPIGICRPVPSRWSMPRGGSMRGGSRRHEQFPVHRTVDRALFR